MKIQVFAARNDLSRGETPTLLIAQGAAEDWYGREPFAAAAIEGLSANLDIAPEGTTDGHNLQTDTTFIDSVRVDKFIPISPLFVRDLAGRTIYIGYGPERKGNVEWESYQPKVAPDGQIPEEELNPFAPLCVFPRFCRDVEAMPGKELLEQVFLTKFRCLDMSLGFNGRLSGAADEDALVAATYTGANLYPYKVRLDTYYTDGWKLPQTQMVYARGLNVGVNPAAARRLGEQFMAAWQGRGQGVGYEGWLEALGDAEVQRMYAAGCTVIPAFEACNGFHVVGPKFELEDYWPGRAVMGLHDVVEQRGDKAPQGTILEVVEPGYVTADHVRPAKVIVSDGSGYVSPNATDPVPLVPNLHLPHPRVLDDWRATWLPTHPEHFETPAIWGWDLTVGRFMQLSGPLWDPLHYYYESVDLVLGEFERTPVTDDRRFVPVPEEMEHRFYPVLPMKGFDTFSVTEYRRRLDEELLPHTSCKRVVTDTYTAGLGYHPLPAEFEFELDTFWFPEMHPMNRGQGVSPPDIEGRIAPVIDPKVTVSTFVPTVDAPEEAVWLKDEALLYTPKPDPMENYPQLTRYTLEDMDAVAVMQVCPVPFLSEPGEQLAQPAPVWWLDGDGKQLDGPLAVQELASNVHDALWDMRQTGVELVQFRHFVYREYLPLYMLAWWNGWSIQQLETAVQDWIRSAGDMPVEAEA